MKIEAPTQDEITNTIQKLKNNKSPGVSEKNGRNVKNRRKGINTCPYQ